MEEKKNTEGLRERFIDMCPTVIDAVEDMITNPEIPVAARVQLIGMVLDRALGKPETPVKVTTNTTGSFEAAEARLMAIVHEIQVEEGMIPALSGETDPDQGRDGNASALAGEREETHE